jgi:hypothetical protein
VRVILADTGPIELHGVIANLAFLVVSAFVVGKSPQRQLIYSFTVMKIHAGMALPGTRFAKHRLQLSMRRD